MTGFKDTGELWGDEPYDDPPYGQFDEEPELSFCPCHGEGQEVTGRSSTGGADPYGVDHLRCGCRVMAFSGAREDHCCLEHRDRPPAEQAQLDRDAAEAAWEYATERGNL